MVEIVVNHALCDGQAFRMKRIVRRMKPPVARGASTGMSIVVYCSEVVVSCIDSWNLVDGHVVQTGRGVDQD
jgi:hypothetical protein